MKINKPKFEVGQVVTAPHYGNTGTVIKVHNLQNSRWTCMEGEQFEYDVRINEETVQTYFEKWLEEVK